MEYLRKFFNEKVKTGSFKDWLQKAKDYKLGKALNFELHHIIPIKVLENNQELQRILNKFGFDFNSIRKLETDVLLGDRNVNDIMSW